MYQFIFKIQLVKNIILDILFIVVKMEKQIAV